MTCWVIITMGSEHHPRQAGATGKESPAQVGQSLLQGGGGGGRPPGGGPGPCPCVLGSTTTQPLTRGPREEGGFGVSSLPLWNLVRASLLGGFQLGLRFSFLVGTGCHLTGSRWRILSSGRGSTCVDPGRSYKLECLAFLSLME